MAGAIGGNLLRIRSQQEEEIRDDGHKGGRPEESEKKGWIRPIAWGANKCTTGQEQGIPCRKVFGGQKQRGKNLDMGFKNSFINLGKLIRECKNRATDKKVVLGSLDGTELWKSAREQPGTGV